MRQVLDKDDVNTRNSPLPCAPRPTLLGEAAMRRKDQGSRWGEVPKSGAGHPPVLPVDFAPSINWAGSNALARTPLSVDDGRTIPTLQTEVLITISKSSQLILNVTGLQI